MDMESEEFLVAVLGLLSELTKFAMEEFLVVP